MKHRTRILDRFALLAVTLVLLPPSAASSGTAAAPETSDPHGAWTERAAADPCDFGRLIALQPACTTPEECEARRLWTGLMPEGPMAAIPIPRGLRQVLPAGVVETEPAIPSDPPALVLDLERTGDPDAQVLAKELGARLRARGLEPGDEVEVLAVPHKGRARRYKLRVPEEGLAPDLLTRSLLEPEPGWRIFNPCPAHR